MISNQAKQNCKKKINQRLNNLNKFCSQLYNKDIVGYKISKYFQTMQKIQKTASKFIKSAMKNLKTFKSTKSKESQQSNLFTPKAKQSSKVQYDIPQQKKIYTSIKKVKSIPVFNNKSSLNNTNQPELNIKFINQGNTTGRVNVNQQQKEFNMLQSISQRKKSPTKHSFSLKLLPPTSMTKRRNQSKKKIANPSCQTTNSKLILQNQQQIDSQKLQVVFHRVDLILKKYKKKEENWNQQRKMLLLQINKYKQKLQRLKTIDNLSYQNSTSRLSNNRS